MKIRTNVYLKDVNKDKLHDVQYMYRKERKKKLAISEIINRVFERLSIEKIIKLLSGGE